MTDTMTDELLSDLRVWLKENWDADLTVGQWWERLGLAGWSAPGLPENAYGKSMARTDTVLVANEIASFGALGAPAGLGLLLAAPTIATHGTQEQIDLYVRDIVTGQKAWCQLFSEPQAGSDLAGLQTRAIKDGDEWIINGQKVWTSGGQYADLGMLLARTDPEVPKHQGISYFAFDMHQDGVDVRPLKEMTGHALFNEVFLTDARVADSALIGGLNNGWAAANTTLMNERAGLGSGGGNAAGGGLAQPGTVLGALGKRVGDIVAPPDKNGKSKRSGGGGGGALTAMRGGAGMLIALAQSKGVNQDAGVRQDLARLYTMGELGRFNGLRVKAVKEAGGDIPGMPNVAKLSMSQIVRLTRDLGLRISGPSGMLHAYDADDKASLVQATGDPFAGGVTEMALFAQAPPIYGGTDQVQRNIIGERVLGLPKEPNNDRVTPFSELPKNA
ncbi:MAG TPA: acyl-CoA dehydrogenase family protein [Acidimicrobiales bacterium]|jgi:alkylation response protein AidB-like acyl-CoA dehydrogenase|nr:acyl-CoA dehydrogenase family protein [Acidimicrobiales bacterium]